MAVVRLHLAGLHDRYAELVLEGLHQHAVLAKEVSIGGTVFTDMVSQMFEDFDDGRRKRRSG